MRCVRRPFWSRSGCPCEVESARMISHFRLGISDLEDKDRVMGRWGDKRISECGVRIQSEPTAEGAV